MTPTGVIAIVLSIVIVMLLIALLIIWFRSNKKNRSLMDEREEFEKSAAKLHSKINELEKNLASAKNSGEGCAARTKQQEEIIRELRDEISKLKRDHDAMIARYNNELKRTRESNSDTRSRIESLESENQSLSEANARLTKEKEELSKNMENSITVNNTNISKYEDLKNKLSVAMGNPDVDENIYDLGDYIHEKPGIFTEAIESGVLTKWTNDKEFGGSMLVRRALNKTFANMSVIRQRYDY